jgi:DNA polymerase III epsilon subunit-like protein
MIYCSIDIETTGLDPDNDQILSVAAIIEDTNNPLPFDEIPKFHAAIKRENISGSMFAINLNSDLIKSIVHYQTSKDQDEKNDIVNMTGMLFLEESDVVESLYQFFYRNGLVELDPGFLSKSSKIVNGVRYPMLTSNMSKVHITCAGKNFGTFDKLFLEKLPRWKQVFRIRQRIMDPSVLFVDWKNDESLPGLSECKKRAGLPPVVTHNALEDAWDVVELFRKKYNLQK